LESALVFIGVGVLFVEQHSDPFLLALLRSLLNHHTCINGICVNRRGGAVHIHKEIGSIAVTPWLPAWGGALIRARYGQVEVLVGRDRDR
jgi:hypothetical protein